MHLNGEPKSVSGTITIEQGKGWFGRFLVWIIGLPKERPKCEVRLVKTVIKNGERWERFFDSDQLATIQRCSPEGIWERAGIWEMLLDISVDDGALVHRQKRTRLCLGPLRLPWPRWLGPTGGAREEADGEGWVQLRVELFAPLAGKIFAYHGRVKAEE